MLLGCESKEKGASPSVSGSPGEAPSTAAPSKISQAQAQYQNQPKDGRQCSMCVNFIAESNACKVVEGEISPSGWCMLWAPKA